MNDIAAMHREQIKFSSVFRDESVPLHQSAEYRKLVVTITERK